MTKNSQAIEGDNLWVGLGLGMSKWLSSAEQEKLHSYREGTWSSDL